MNKMINFSYTFLLLGSSFALGMEKNSKIPLFISPLIDRSGMEVVLVENDDRLSMFPKGKVNNNIREEYVVTQISNKNDPQTRFGRTSFTVFGMPLIQSRLAAVIQPNSSEVVDPKAYETTDYTFDTRATPQAIWAGKLGLIGLGFSGLAALGYWWYKK